MNEKLQKKNWNKKKEENEIKEKKKKRKKEKKMNEKIIYKPIMRKKSTIPKEIIIEIIDEEIDPLQPPNFDIKRNYHNKQ